LHELIFEGDFFGMLRTYLYNTKTGLRKKYWGSNYPKKLVCGIEVILFVLCIQLLYLDTYQGIFGL